MSIFYKLLSKLYISNIGLNFFPLKSTIYSILYIKLVVDCCQLDGSQSFAVVN